MLMEMGLDTGTASLVAVADGTTSLYLSTGGGVIGGGGHQAVRRASEAFLDAAEAHLDRLQAIAEAPLPHTGAMRFHALTFDSLRSAEAQESELVDGRSELTPLFHAGDEVLTQLGLIDQRRIDRLTNRRRLAHRPPRPPGGGGSGAIWAQASIA